MAFGIAPKYNKALMTLCKMATVSLMAFALIVVILVFISSSDPESTPSSNHNQIIPENRIVDKVEAAEVRITTPTSTKTFIFNSGAEFDIILKREKDRAVLEIRPSIRK